VRGDAILYQDGRYSEARAVLRRLEVSTPDVEIDFHLGRLALWFDDQGEALARLERALAASPREARLHNAWGDACGLAAQQAALWQKPGWARRCLAAYRRAVELEPTNVKWRWSLVGFGCVAPRIVGAGLMRRGRRRGSWRVWMRRKA
jgi:Flp pilus assembly protein TadD